MADSSESVFLFKGIKIELSRIADYSAILQQPHSLYVTTEEHYNFFIPPFQPV